MATKSFFKNIVIKDKKSALNFLSVLEKASIKNKETIMMKTEINDINDEETIRNMFSKTK